MNGFGAQNIPATQFPRKAGISGLQSFSNVQALVLARPPGCAYRRELQSSLGSWAVDTTQWTRSYPPELWPRYMAESGKCHGRTFLCWTVALSAATSYPPDMS